MVAHIRLETAPTSSSMALHKLSAQALNHRLLADSARHSRLPDCVTVQEPPDHGGANASGNGLFDHLRGAATGSHFSCRAAVTAPIA